MNLIIKARKALGKDDPFNLSTSADLSHEDIPKSHASTPTPAKFVSMSPPEDEDFQAPFSASTLSHGTKYLEASVVNGRSLESLDEEEGMVEDLLNRECDSLLLKLRNQMMDSYGAATEGRSQSAPEIVK